MAMLAEPRRKQKWSVDPRNSSWSNDDSKFGQKMLERMGWSKGKGLGKSEQGSTDHIKVKLKNNSLGLGANVSHEDNWIAHQDDFNELLAQLNNCHGQSNNTDSPQEEQTGFSLEEKSKTAKKRVHYMKFTKGKDLSSRSEKDLNCIFGKRVRSTKDQDQEQESSSSDSQGEKEESVPSSASAELDPESITKTVTSTLTMQEYFAKRMADLKRARGQAQGESSKNPGPSEDPSPAHIIDDDAEEPKKKKKKKKSKKAEEVEGGRADPIVAKDEDQEREYSAKKKKKRKAAENEAPTNENCDCAPVEELPPPKKKKKQKKQKRETEQLNGHMATEDQSVESEVVGKRKKKHREEVEGGGKVDAEASTEKKTKKEKKKKKKRSEEAELVD